MIRLGSGGELPCDSGGTGQEDIPQGLKPGFRVAGERAKAEASAYLEAKTKADPLRDDKQKNDANVTAFSLVASRTLYSRDSFS
jgi:hypothetical protein